MLDKFDKRDTAHLFRIRLAEAMAHSGTNRAALARGIGVDRSTISQLLSDTGARMPNGHLVAALARQLGVSCDWLLGLSQTPQAAAERLRTALGVTRAQRALVEEQILDWHRAAEGYKIRHVPATLPDMLKTTALLMWDLPRAELDDQSGQAVEAAREKLAWMRSTENDYEIALPFAELSSLKTGSGYYSGLSAEARAEQFHWMAELTEHLYPSLRVFTFDPRVAFSAPITIYGPKLAALYLGHDYLTYHDGAQVRACIRHFDWLVRAALFPPDDMPGILREMGQAVARG